MGLGLVRKTIPARGVAQDPEGGGSAAGAGDQVKKEEKIVTLPLNQIARGGEALVFVEDSIFHIHR